MELPLHLIRADCENLQSMVQITAAKLLANPFGGIAQYLARGTQVHSIKVRNTHTRMAEVKPLFDFARKIGIPEHSINTIRNITDELLMNAMYDAPRDRNGNHKYASLPRTQEIKLNEFEAPALEFGSDGSYLGIGVLDPFGGLSEKTILAYLEKCLFNLDKQYDDKPGGAGLGLYEIYKNADHLAFNVNPGVLTEVLCLIKLKIGVKFSNKGIESLGFFQRGPEK
jgi:hypothetical protein